MRDARNEAKGGEGEEQNAIEEKGLETQGMLRVVEGCAKRFCHR